ncbi:MAG: hypothetical protein ABSH03_13140 [Candidatus Lustribacter sp.]|jgi:hypothetical protein
MARKPTLTEYTNSESHATFKAAVAKLGQGVDSRTDRHHTVLVDGVSLGERQKEMRKPDTSFYEKTFIEANAVAHLAVNLGLDREGVVDVRRRATPLPDTELTLDDATIAFIEQTMVMDQAAHRLTLDVEALNAATRRCQDPLVLAAFKAGILNLRFGAIPVEYYTAGLPIDNLFEEIVALARSLDGDKMPLKPDKSEFPLLAGMSTFGSYRIGGETRNPVMLLVDHGRPQLFRAALTEQIRKKKEKAAGYPGVCRPLWLLLNVEMHFGFHDYTDVARAVIADEKLTEYDRVFLQQAHFALLSLNFLRE